MLMHELSIATEMVRTVQDVLSREGAREVVSIAIQIGVLSGVERESLEFCFPIAAQGTPMAEARLVVEEIPLSVRCASCEKDSSPDIGLLMCGQCGSTNVAITGGRDVVIKSLEVR
jgi:hydrogenase nickel incorporation protein HypA/HybF